MSTKPENYAIGVVDIPVETFWVWAQTNLPASQFYTMGGIEVTPTHIKVAYSTSSAGVPPPPDQILIEKIQRGTD